MEKSRELTLGLTTEPGGTWVQTERAAHERWAKLTLNSPKAGALMHTLIANMGRHNAVVVSLPTLARLTGLSRNTLIRALDVLKKQNWLEVRRLGAAGTTNCYIVNDRVAWSGARDGLRYSLFSAAVLVSEEEQPDRAELGTQASLEQVPVMFTGETQLPSGDGLPPPSQPAIPALEGDLPARRLKGR
jgi:hypothetical protein